MDTLEKYITEDLHRYLQSEGEMDIRTPDAPDIEGKWEQIAEAYIPDGIREFNGYPTVSLGWMMYVGMAVAKYWDEEWEIYDKVENLYTYLRDQQGYDTMDEYIREKVLLLKDADFKKAEDIVSECASRTYAALRRQHIEPGTKEAFHAYVACLHQLYLAGAYMQLYRMGYKMTKM